MNSFWRSGKDYDIETESRQLRNYGEPFLVEHLKAEGLNSKRPLLADFGCWSGRHLKLLERVAECHGGQNGRDRVIGIDEPFAKARLDEAGRANRGFHVIDKGIADTGLPPSSVDAAICWRVLHNLTNQGEWTNALSEIRRVLKNNAPIVIAIRSALDWMPQNAPTPLLYRSYTTGADRDDLYFSEQACYAMFKFYGFDFVFDAMKFAEEEVVNGNRIKNDYWMLCLVCNKYQLATVQSARPSDTSAPGRKMPDTSRKL